jgi:chaperonin GroEL
MGTSHRKIKTVAKVVVPKGKELSAKILKTMKQVADVVGATLGPGGCPVLIERQEYAVQNAVTKDGVTVFRSLGFNDAVAHAIMETARDASVRTAIEAGDGTTTATVLAEAIVRYTHEFCENNPKVSSQRVVRVLEKIFRDVVEPTIKGLSVQPDEALLHAVAKCSANGDAPLADAIMECFTITGDDGNVTIFEQNGPSAYKVEALKGFPVGVGYEDSCGRFYPMFVNDRTNGRCHLEKPKFILSFGPITEIQQLIPILDGVAGDLSKWMILKSDPNNTGPLPPEPNRNIVVVATGFSESVLAHLGHNFENPNSLNIVPLVVPKSPIQSGQLHFLQDLQAVTGSKIFDPIRAPITAGSKEDMGYELDYFEMHRYRSTVVGIGDESYLLGRVEEVRAQIKNGAYESDMELGILKERLGKLTGGIAKLTVVGSSSGEIREKKDRAEDAVCAVRGAIKHGCLPGGCWALMKTTAQLNKIDSFTVLELNVVYGVLIPALLTPFNRLLENCGFNEEEVRNVSSELIKNLASEEPIIYDAMEQKFVEAKGSGVMDSTPAVLEAVRNSISIASLLGTLGGCVVFPRDTELERSEAVDNINYMADD